MAAIITDPFKRAVFEDLNYKMDFSKRLILLLDRKDAVLIDTVNRGLDNFADIEMHLQGPKVQLIIKFYELFYALKFKTDYLPRITSAFTFEWRKSSSPTTALRISGLTWSLCCVTLKTLNVYSVDEGVVTVPLKICVQTNSGLFVKNLLPVDVDPGVLKELDLQLDGCVLKLNGRVLIDSVQAKPKLVLHTLVSDLVKGESPGNKRFDNIFIFQNWDEARVFQQLFAKHGGQSGLEKYVKFLGVLDNQGFEASQSKDVLNTVEMNLEHQMVLNKKLRNLDLAVEFIRTNCVKLGHTRSSDLEQKSLPANLAVDLCFLTLEFVSIKNDYYITALDICLTNQGGVKGHIFFPIRIPGLDPGTVFGDSYNKAQDKCMRKGSSKLVDLVSEENAFLMLFEGINATCSAGCSLVVYSLYLTLPPLLAAIRRHSMERKFYSTFKSVIEVLSLYGQETAEACPSLEDSTNQYEPTPNVSPPMMLRTIFMNSKDGCEALSVPVSKVHFSSKLDAFPVTITVNKIIPRLKSHDIFCKIPGDLTRLTGTSKNITIGIESYILILTKNIPECIWIQLTSINVKHNTLHVKLINKSKNDVSLNFEKEELGVLQKHPSRCGIPTLIPHLKGVNRVLKSTEKINVVSGSFFRTNKSLDTSLNNSLDTSSAIVQIEDTPESTNPSQMDLDLRNPLDKSSDSVQLIDNEPITTAEDVQLIGNEPITAVEDFTNELTTLGRNPLDITEESLDPPTETEDLILASFKYDKDWYMQLHFNSLLLNKPSLSLVIRPNFQECEHCSCKTSLHGTAQCPSLRLVFIFNLLFQGLIFLKILIYVHDFKNQFRKKYFEKKSKI